MDLGFVEVRRDARILALIRKCGVLIDGAKVGEVGNGGSLRIPVEVGQHEVQARLSWVTSSPQAIVVHAGRTTTITFALPKLYELHRAALGPFHGPMYFSWSDISVID